VQNLNQIKTLNAYQYMLHDIQKKEATLLMQESTAWLRLLDQTRQENSYLITRLSEAVDQKTGIDFLNEAEYFQNTLILKDELITEIISDVKKQQDKLKERLLANKKTDEQLLKQQQKLRNEINRLEKDFIAMKDEFNKKILILF
jgi:hypothetical protein